MSNLFIFEQTIYVTNVTKHLNYILLFSYEPLVIFLRGKCLNCAKSIAYAFVVDTSNAQY